MHISMRFIVFLSALIYPITSFGEVRICATNEQIQSFCNTRKVKTVFIFNNKIHFIDFSEENPKITAIAATSGAVMPVISPDGALIAYNNGILYDPPINGNANIYVCTIDENAEPTLEVREGFVPRFDFAANEPVLIYSTCGRPSAEKVYVWDGCGQVMKKNLLSKEITTVFEGGSYYGGLSFDGKYLATAESNLNAFLLDLQHPQKGPSILHSLLVKEIDTNRDVKIDIQTCSPSISSSRIFTNTAMYIDFSSSAIENAGCYHPIFGYWGFHQRIFIGRNDGVILKYFDVPSDITDIPENEMGKGEVYSVSWDNPEWSNHPYYAAAATSVDRLWKETIFEHTYLNEDLYLINLKDSTYLKLAEVTDTSKNSQENILWPFVWIETPANFAEIENSEWLEPHYIGVKKRAYNKNRTSTINVKNNHLSVDGDKITQIRLFSYNGRLLWSRKYPKSQHTVILPSELVAGKLLICNIILSSGRNISAPVSFL